MEKSPAPSQMFLRAVESMLNAQTASAPDSGQGQARKLFEAAGAGTMRGSRPRSLAWLRGARVAPSLHLRSSLPRRSCLFLAASVEPA